MFDDLPTLVRLLKGLQQIPYLASKNIYRVAAHFLEMNQQQLEQFCALLQEARNKITQCPVCFALREADRPCSYCASPKREQHIVCVVETWQELLAIEKTGGYTGLYHVLGGVVCPLDGVGPEDLTIDQLVKRIHDDAGNTIKEIILATNQTPEGEATASFIAAKLKDSSVLISCLARGIPVGSSLEYMDRLTVYKALSERRPF